MHPVKGRDAIKTAFHRYGVTDFAFDSRDELEKILQETVPVGLVGTPPTLGLFVRLAVAQGGAYDLSGKFGVAVAEAAELLRAARPHAARLGICFHVGSQCLDPAAYGRAMALAAEAAALSGVAIDIIDVGGGFPVSYPEIVPPPLADYMAAIGTAAARVRRGRAAVGRARAGRWWPAAGRWSCRCSCGAAMRSTSMTACMAASAMPAGPRSAFRRVASARTRPTTADRRCASSCCSGRPATAPTGCRGRSCCPTTSTRATGSSWGSSVPMAPACAPGSTASIRS